MIVCVTKPSLVPPAESSIIAQKETWWSAVKHGRLPVHLNRGREQGNVFLGGHFLGVFGLLLRRWNSIPSG